MANFIIVNEKKIKIIDRIVHKFIWNSPIERIKRNTLILPYDNGGLKSVCIRARLNTILTKNFIYIVNNKDRMFYQLSIKYLKFQLREFGLKNFNLIPGFCFNYHNNHNKQYFYKEMSDRVKKFRKSEPDFINKINKYDSKYIYSVFLKDYCIQPKVEDIYKKNCVNDWTEVYKRLHSVSENTELYKLYNIQVAFRGIIL